MNNSEPRKIRFGLSIIQGFAGGILGGGIPTIYQRTLRLLPRCMGDLFSCATQRKRQPGSCADYETWTITVSVRDLSSGNNVLLSKENKNANRYYWSKRFCEHTFNSSPQV